MMPGPYIHISAMRHTQFSLQKSGFPRRKVGRIAPDAPGEAASVLGNLLGEYPNYAALGAIGPDLFFFLPDFRDAGGLRLSSVLVGVLNFMTEFYDTLDPFVKRYHEFLGPLIQNKEEAVSRLTGGLSEAVSDVLGGLMDLLTLQLERLVTHQFDFFANFSLGLNEGLDEKSFLWSDMLHYKKTGQFAQNLWNCVESSESAPLRSYALGYLTHIGTDVTGHALVNAISGGPFRLHWQRHHLVENHLDSMWSILDPMRQQVGPNYRQFTESALYYDIAFGPGGARVPRPDYPSGNTLRERFERKRLLDISSELPDEIAVLLIEALEQTFYVDSAVHPQILRADDGKPNVKLIRQTYDLLFKFLKMTTTDALGADRPQPPDVFPNLGFPVWSDPGSGSAPGDDPDDSSFWDDLLDFFLSLFKAFVYLLQVGLWLASLPWAALADVVTYPLRVGIYYALELPLWHMIKSVRAALVMTGYLAPTDDEISPALTRVGYPEAAAFEDVKQAMNDVFGGMYVRRAEDGGNTWRDPAYPHLNGIDNFRAPWLYPGTSPELPSSPDPDHVGVAKERSHVVTASPHARGTDVQALFDSVVGADSKIVTGLEAAATPHEADVVGLTLKPGSHLGSAVSFSKYLCWLATRTHEGDGKASIVDWNLDADRGYGYHCWDWNRDDKSSVEDPQGHHYHPPCVPPSQVELGFDKNRPVLLHFDESPSPPCDNHDLALSIMTDGKVGEG